MASDGFIQNTDTYLLTIIIGHHCRHREVTLVFFNKTMNDILWREQLDRLAAAVDW